jgi:hypothetical protein
VIFSLYQAIHQKSIKEAEKMFAFFAGFAILKTRKPQGAAPLAVCLKT